MKVTLLSLSVLVVTVVAQTNVFEVADFNVTEALIENGINVAVIPELVGLTGRSTLSGCSIACSSLKLIYGNTTLLSEGTSDYDSFTGSYWSGQQGDVNPRCVFKPTSNKEVSSIILLARLTQCPFAIKGGGHAAFAGASSIEGGITVSMENFKQVIISEDSATVDVGPGNRWVDVYNTTDSAGVGVLGARVSRLSLRSKPMLTFLSMAPVGVPGFLLGGGISFFSNKFGWACDNVAEYEVVTASGVVVKASPTTFPDLFWALRGGGSNFGIITNFKLVTFPLGQMWGGQRIYTEANFPAVLDATYNFAVTGSSKDHDAAQIVSFGSITGLGKVAIVQMHYAQPTANTSVFSDLNAIQAAVDDTSISSLGALTIKMNSGPDDAIPRSRQTQWDVSFQVDRELFTFLTDTFYTLLPSVQNFTGIFPTISIQAITGGQLKGMQRNGGNALGLDATKGPYFIMNMGAKWTNAADDGAVLRFFSTIIKQVKAEAQRRGLDNAFIYINYASQFQEPIASYGAANMEKLVAVAKKYDPTSVFQVLHPGYFKLRAGPPDKNIP